MLNDLKNPKLLKKQLNQSSSKIIHFSPSGQNSPGYSITVSAEPSKSPTPRKQVEFKLDNALD